MDGLTLLAEAAAAGLTVWADGDRLVIRGPRSGQDVARRLLGHKADVLAVLAVGVAADDPYAGWVRRPDCHGRTGWEAPNLPEWQRWWARADFDDLAPVPEGFRFGDAQKPALQDCAHCVPSGTVDMFGPRGRAAPTRPATGLWRGVKMGKVGLRDGATAQNRKKGT